MMRYLKSPVPTISAITSSLRLSSPPRKRGSITCPRFIGQPLQPLRFWIPASAGMTRRAVEPSMHPLIFLQRADVSRPRRVRIELRPLRPRDFADIEVAARIDAEPVRPEKRGRRGAGVHVAKARQQLALIVDDADPGPEVRAVAVDRLHRPELADIADRMTGIIHVEPAGPVQIVPLRLVFAVAVKHLDAVVFAVGDIDPAIGVGADIVHDIELAGVGAGAAPRHQQFAVGRIFVHLGIAVAVGDIDLAFWREGGVGAAVERLAAHIGRRLPRHAQLEHYLAVERAFADEMSAVIGQIDRIVRPHMNAVRPRILALAPGAQKIALAIEHHDRMFAAIENVDVVPGVDADCPDLLERPAFRQLRPILDDTVFEIAGANNDRHAGSPPYALSASYRSNRLDSILVSPVPPAGATAAARRLPPTFTARTRGSAIPRPGWDEPATGTPPPRLW